MYFFSNEWFKNPHHIQFQIPTLIKKLLFENVLKITNSIPRFYTSILNIAHYLFVG